jgi:hypothetical protein
MPILKYQLVSHHNNTKLYILLIYVIDSLTKLNRNVRNERSDVMNSEIREDSYLVQTHFLYTFYFMLHFEARVVSETFRRL